VRQFRSLLINNVDIRMPRLHIRMFAVHRHLRKHTRIEAHRHKWSQALLYLAGAGRQIFTDGEVPIEPGTLVVVPQRVTHAFERTTSRVPLCLIINFRLKAPKAYPRVLCAVNHSELTQIRQQLAYLFRLQSKANEILAWESAAIILQLLITLLRAAGWLEKAPALLSGGPDSAIHRLLFSMDLTIPLQQIADRSGYQRDHFNRLVKRETGLSLGQFRIQRRLFKSKELLAHGIKVADAANAVGIPDQSYFARWFRVHTGQTPSEWVQQHRNSHMHL
jgi:AraC family transcriptional activator of pobA